jgi:hypothetical protein
MIEQAHVGRLSLKAITLKQAITLKDGIGVSHFTAPENSASCAH